MAPDANCIATVTCAAAAVVCAVAAGFCGDGFCSAIRSLPSLGVGVDELRAKSSGAPGVAPSPNGSDPDGAEGSTSATRAGLRESSGQSSAESGSNGAGCGARLA